MIVEDGLLHLFETDDDFLGPIVEVYEGSTYLGRIVYRFDDQSPTYRFEPADPKERCVYLCWQESEDLAVSRFKRRYHAARRRL